MLKENKQYKIVLLGDQGDESVKLGVGKTSIANVFVKNEFNSYENATSGANFHSKKTNVDNHTLTYSVFESFKQIWDTAGQEKFRSLARLYYRDANAAILVYDVTNMKSFSMVSAWINELNENSENVCMAIVNLVKFIVGNKTDQIEKEEVGYDVAKQLADNYGCFLMFASAKEKTGINELFQLIGRELLKQVPVEPERSQSEIKQQQQQQIPQPLQQQQQIQQDGGGCC